MLAIVDRIKWYPIILAISYIFPVAHRLTEITSNKDPYWLVLTASIISSRMEGFLDAYIYSQSPLVSKRWQELFHDIIHLKCFQGYKKTRIKKQALFNPLIDTAGSSGSGGSKLTNSNGSSNKTTSKVSSGLRSASTGMSRGSVGSSFFSVNSSNSHLESKSPEEDAESVDIEIYTGVSYPGLFEKLDKNRESLWSQGNNSKHQISSLRSSL